MFRGIFGNRTITAGSYLLTARARQAVIEYQDALCFGSHMRKLLSSALTLLLATAAAQAACFVDYKAKQDDPLRLQYGVAEIFGACTLEDAYVELLPRLAEADWQLLAVLTIFDEQGLEERKESAGEFFLRF